jgi:hypothetical protein
MGLSSATSSRWGSLGSEDLGGGLNAIFDLENGYTLGTGGLSQGGLEFGRKVYVGLQSNTWGTVTLARQYSASNDATSNFASGADWAASGLGYGTRAGDVDNVDTSNRVQNSIKYTSRELPRSDDRRSVQPTRPGWRLLAQRSHGRSGVVLERRGQARRELHVHQGPVLRNVRRPGQFVVADLGCHGCEQQHG